MGTQAFQESRATRSAASTWAVERRTSGLCIIHSSLDGGAAGRSSGVTARIDGALGKDGHAQGLLGLAHEELGELKLRLGRGHLLGRAHVVETAALPRVQPRLGVVLEGLAPCPGCGSRSPADAARR